MDCSLQLTRKHEFLVNYLGDRRKEWGIDEPVSSLFTNVEDDIAFLIESGFVAETPAGYTLTSLGVDAGKQFRSVERHRKDMCQHKIFEYALMGDFLSAYNARAAYERGCVIPHGIFVSFGGEAKQWAEETTLPHSVKNCIELSRKLDFSDSMNTDTFKWSLRNFCVGHYISGDKLRVPADLEARVGERLVCPSLDRQLAEKCQFLAPPRLELYLSTKIVTLNYIQTGLLAQWDGNFMLGAYDCTDPFHAAMADYEKLRIKEVPGLPKTFQTFWKHREKDSEKYRIWIACK